MLIPWSRCSFPAGLLSHPLPSWFVRAKFPQADEPYSHKTIGYSSRYALPDHSSLLEGQHSVESLESWRYLR